MFSFKQIPNSEGYYKVFINGELCEEIVAYKYKSSGSKDFEFFSRNNISSKKLISQELQDFNPFSYIELKDVFDWLDFEHILGISQEYIKNRKSGNIRLSFSFAPKLFEWNKTYSFGFYVTAFEQFWEKENGLGAEYRVYSEENFGFEIAYTIPFTELPVEEILAPYEKIIRDNHEKTLEVLSEINSGESIYSYFNFPEELKTPCEQYLLYFAKFLQDLGINATSNLKEEAGKVLFSVTPTDDVEALDKIREALALYLNLPESPILDIEDNGNFAIMRLKQQVENLQHSQRMTSMELRLAQKVIEDQDKLLKQSYLQNEQFAKVLEKITSKSIMMDSAENKEEFVKICEGLEIGESKFVKEQLGTKFNPAKFIKSIVENTLGKGDEIIELNLNKDE